MHTKIFAYSKIEYFAAGIKRPYMILIVPLQQFWLFTSSAFAAGRCGSDSTEIFTANWLTLSYFEGTVLLNKLNVLQATPGIDMKITAMRAQYDAASKKHIVYIGVSVKGTGSSIDAISAWNGTGFAPLYTGRYFSVVHVLQ